MKTTKVRGWAELLSLISCTYNKAELPVPVVLRVSKKLAGHFSKRSPVSLMCFCPVWYYLLYYSYFGGWMNSSLWHWSPVVQFPRCFCIVWFKNSDLFLSTIPILQEWLHQTISASSSDNKLQNTLSVMTQLPIKQEILHIMDIAN